MKKIFIICVCLLGILSGRAQTVIDNFTVGPYVVDYKGQGDVKYRLRNDVDLYEFFELRKDTTIVASEVVIPVAHAIQIDGFVGANRSAAKEIGVSGVWKQNVATNLYLNGGLSLDLGIADFLKQTKRTMMEIGIPLQVEWGKLSHQKAGLYGIFGIDPTVYTTLSAKVWKVNEYVDAGKEFKKSGFLIAPSLEFGGNIPVGGIIMRIGVYGRYKINCTTGEYNIYKESAGRCFLGAKIGVVL